MQLNSLIFENSNNIVTQLNKTHYNSSFSFLVKIIESRHKCQVVQEKEDAPTVTSAEKDFLNHKVSASVI